jgi:hypothetical protein
VLGASVPAVSKGFLGLPSRERCTRHTATLSDHEVMRAATDGEQIAKEVSGDGVR